ncbi:MAG: hypothetical protein ACYSWS_11400 [Planctomycetota bacterium]|jgi:hypothetical protein
MGEAKLEIKIGELQFSGEGPQDWLSKQLDKILDQSKELIKLSPPSNSVITKSQHEAADFSGASEIVSQPLATFLKEKNATTNQVEKFLATSIWLEAKGKNRLKTSDVSEAIKTANQTKLKNASDSLNKNVTKGLCEKDGKEFYVTQEGKNAMGV